jgi:aspartate aminotransferase-like enzyme
VATVAKGAAGVAAGAAAIGFAAWTAAKKPRRPKVLGVTLPRGLSDGKINPKKLDMKKVDMKKVAKQVSDWAERVEKTSEDVRTTSGQVKRVSKRLS